MDWKSTLRPDPMGNLSGWIQLERFASLIPHQTEHERRLELFTSAYDQLEIEMKSKPEMSVDDGIEFVAKKCTWLTADEPVFEEPYGHDYTLRFAVELMYKSVHEEDEDDDWGDEDDACREDAKSRSDSWLPLMIWGSELNEYSIKAIEHLISAEQKLFGIAVKEVTKLPHANENNLQIEQIVVSPYHDGDTSYIEIVFSIKDDEHGQHVVLRGSKVVACVDSGAGWMDDAVVNKSSQVNPFES